MRYDTIWHLQADTTTPKDRKRLQNGGTSTNPSSARLASYKKRHSSGHTGHPIPFMKPRNSLGGPPGGGTHISGDRLRGDRSTIVGSIGVSGRAGFGTIGLSRPLAKGPVTG